MNLLNQRTGNGAAFGPRNLLNTVQGDMEGDGLDGNLLNTRIPDEYPDIPTLYSNAGFDSGMPVFRPGEVSSAPEKAVPRPAAPVPAPQPAPGLFDRIKSAVADLKDQYDGAGRREEGIQELPPNISVGGQDNGGYSKLTLARDNNAAAKEIALKQYPGSSIREDQWGNLIIKLPDGATRAEAQPAGFTDERHPTVEAQQVPISGEFYLNRPGFSQRDVANAATKQAITGTGALLGGELGGAVGLPWQGAAAGAAIGSEAMDAMAQQAGSTQGVNAWDMAKAAVRAGAMRGAPEAAKYLIQRGF